MRILYFPDQPAMIQSLNNHPSLNQVYLQWYGITPVVSETAAKRFANTRISEVELKRKNAVLIEDLKWGKDYSGENVSPNLSHLKLCPLIWTAILESSERAILDSGSTVL